MFSLDIVDSDEFLKLTKTAQLLYFHLGMRADDDGFVKNPKGIMSLIGVKRTAYTELVTKKWLIEFNNGVVVVTHWKLNNYIQKDRYKPTIYIKEKAYLQEDNGVYVYRMDTVLDTESDSNGIPFVYRTGYQMDTGMYPQYSIGKCSIDKDSVVVVDDNNDNLYIPQLEDIKKYIDSNNYTFDPEYFYNYYKSKNWYIGNKLIENFEQLKSIMNNWQKKESDKTNLPVVKNSFNNFEQRVYTDNEIEQRLNDRLTKKGFWLLYIAYKGHTKGHT